MYCIRPFFEPSFWHFRGYFFPPMERTAPLHSCDTTIEHWKSPKISHTQSAFSSMVHKAIWSGVYGLFLIHERILWWPGTTEGERGWSDMISLVLSYTCYGVVLRIEKGCIILMRLTLAPRAYIYITTVSPGENGTMIGEYLSFAHLYVRTTWLLPVPGSRLVSSSVEDPFLTTWAMKLCSWDILGHNWIIWKEVAHL